MGDGAHPTRAADWLGQVYVDPNARFGTHTARAVANFPDPPVGLRLADRPALVRALLEIKRAAAIANRHLGLVDDARADCIVRAADLLMATAPSVADFPVHLLHGGGGTSANMNVNEVLTQVANVDPHGAGLGIDALDHVNKSQSTNDVYPSACRIALIGPVRDLAVAIRHGRDVLDDLSTRYDASPRLARTCLRDAVASTFGTFFGAWASAWARAIHRIETASEALVTISIGGGIAGQPNASPPGFGEAVAAELERRGVASGVRLARHLADAAQHTDDLLGVAHALDAFGRILIKQAHDLRMLASGPDGGLNEVHLPAVQPGSSAVPGKVNPVIAEFAIQCAMQSAATTTACAAAVERADLDLNVWEGVMFTNLDLSSRLLTSSVTSLVTRCLDGIVIDKELNEARARVSTARIAESVLDGSYSAGLRELGLAPTDP